MAAPSNLLGGTTRAEEVMLRTRPDQRTSPRAAVCLSATATFVGTQCVDLIALLRDVSNHGAMFYTNLPDSIASPSIGSEIYLRFQMPLDDHSVRVVWSGRIVRLIRYAAGAAVGIAMKLEHQQITRL
jgi:hypothetical protein